MEAEGYKSLKIWQTGIEIALLSYQITKSFPSSEKFGLTSQINRCSVSIPANIAEGYGRNSNKEFIQFLYIALGSCNELDTHIIISRELGLVGNSEFNLINGLRLKVARMICAFITKRKAI